MMGIYMLNFGLTPIGAIPLGILRAEATDIRVAVRGGGMRAWQRRYFLTVGFDTSDQAAVVWRLELTEQ